MAQSGAEFQQDSHQKSTQISHPFPELWRSKNKGIENHTRNRMPQRKKTSIKAMCIAGRFSRETKANGNIRDRSTK